MSNIVRSEKFIELLLHSHAAPIDKEGNVKAYEHGWIDIV